MRPGGSRLIGAAAAALALVAGLPGAASAATSWTLQTVNLPAGANGGTFTSVSCPTATTCLADGSVAGVNGLSVERWDGSTWSPQTLPFPPGQNAGSLADVSCASATACTVTGEYTTSQGAEVMTAEHWDGTTWTPETVPQPPGAAADAGTLAGVSCPTATTCTAIGRYFTGPGTFLPLAERWTGTAWKVQATPLPPGATQGQFLGVSCSAAASCTAVGWAASNPNQASPLAEHWNGSTWTIQAAQPAPSGVFAWLTAVSCTSAANCIAAGAYDNSSNAELPFAQHWNGSTWSVTSTPLPLGAVNGELDGVSCPTAASCTAAGWWNKGSGGTGLAEVWNGTAWRAQPTAQPPSRKRFAAISCVAARTCTAVGTALPQGALFFQPFAEHE